MLPTLFNWQARDFDGGQPPPRPEAAEPFLGLLFGERFHSFAKEFFGSHAHIVPECVAAAATRRAEWLRG